MLSMFIIMINTDVIDMIKDTIDEGKLEDAKDYLEQFKDHYVYETFKESGLVIKSEDA